MNIIFISKEEYVSMSRSYVVHSTLHHRVYSHKLTKDRNLVCRKNFGTSSSIMTSLSTITNALPSAVQEHAELDAESHAYSSISKSLYGNVMSCSFVSVRLTTVAAGEVMGDMLTFILLLPIVMFVIILLLATTSWDVDDRVDAIVERGSCYFVG